jgi:hypothetical protein
MKKLKFMGNLPEKILNCKKTSTWRVNDEKNIVLNDELSLCNLQGEEFAKAIVIYVKETKFKDLTENDWEGHEKYSSEKEMYVAFSNMYKTEILPETKLKIIKFSLIKVI